MKRFAFLALAILLILPQLATTAEASDKKIKAGFIYVGPVGDAGWTYAHDEGRKEMEKLSFVEPSTYIESVPEGAESARVINGLVRKGHNLVFTTSFGYMDATLDVAKRNKDVKLVAFDQQRA